MEQSVAQWALVTGASSGLGVEFAKALAARRFNVALAARSEGPMQELAAELRQQHGVQSIVEVIDLAQTDSAALLQQRLDQRNIDPDILINNAAFGLAGAFIDHPPRRLREMLQLDVVTMTELTHLFGKRMTDRGRGHILLVASVAAYSPTPMLAAYGAAKAFVVSLGEALHVELAPKVGVTVLSPGLMDTGFNAASGYEAPDFARRTILATAKVAEIGLDAMFAGKSGVIAGRLNRFMTFSNRFTSRHFQAKTLFRMQKD